MGPKTNLTWVRVGRGNFPRHCRSRQVSRLFGHTCNSESDGFSPVGGARGPCRQPAKKKHEIRERDVKSYWPVPKG